MTGIQINPPTILMDRMIVPENNIYKTGDTLGFIITYNENVFVTGTPSIKITLGSTSKQANYVNGSGSNTFQFSYIIQNGDEDIDGIKISSSISLNNGSFKDALGNNAPLILPVVNSSGIIIDAVAPVINSVQVPVNGTYKAGDTLVCMLHFSETVNLSIKSDLPFIKITIGSSDKNILYTKGSGTRTLFFSYVVQYGDLDKNGIGIGSTLTLNNSTLTDSVGNTAIITFKITASLANIKIDAVSPVFTVTKTDTVQLCANSSAVIISNAFSVTDEETGELVSWKIKNNLKYGSLSMFAYSANSNGRNIIPSGILYTPFSNQYGIDTIVTEITDGINTSQKMIVLNILPPIQNNTVSSPQLICAGQRPADITGSETIGGTGSYKYIWETASIDSLHFSIANGVSDQQNYFPPVLNNNTWFRRRVLSGTCSDSSFPVKISMVKNGLWLGNNSTDWHNANNWCSNVLPNGSTDVLIKAKTLYEPFITDTAKCNHLIISGNTHLSITGILQLNGNINSSDGSIRSGMGTIILNGSTPQNINGKLFEDHSVQNIIINNAAGVSLFDDLLLTRSLLLNNGTLQTNDHLFLKHKAVIGASPTGTYIKGSVSLEHLIKETKRVFHLLGNPFANDMGLQMIKDSMDITGDSGSLNGFTTTTTNQPSAFHYDPFAGNDSTGIETGWIPFTHTNGLAENVWKKYTGIRLLVRGRPGQGLDGTPPGDGKNGTYFPQPVMLKLSGNINTGDQEVILQKDIYAGYNVVANPYASNIDLSRVTRGTDIGNYYWLWSPLQGKQGGYTSFSFRSKNVLPPFGVFITKVNGMNYNKLLFTEHCKSSEAIPDSIPVSNFDDVFYMELRLETDSIFWDRLVIIQIDSARTGYDKNDADKFLNGDVNFYSLSREQKMLSIDARPINNESIIPLGIQTNEPGIFTIRIVKNNLSIPTGLMLHDKYLDKWMALEKDSIYHFTTTTDTASSGNKRFEISGPKKIIDTVVVKPGIILKINPIPAKDMVTIRYSAPEKGNTSIRILSLSGKLMKSIQLGLQKDGQVIIPVGDLISGIYLLELVCGNERCSQKMIKD